MNMVLWKIATGLSVAAIIALVMALANATWSRNEARRGRDAAVARAEALTVSLATSRVNVMALEQSVRRQAAATQEAVDQAAAQQQEGARQLQQVTQRNADLLASVQTLRSLLAGAERPMSCEEGWDAFRAAIGR